jgi:protein N-terminal amidase
MDLNPFTPDRNDESWQYELADYCLTSKTDLLVLLNAWLDPGIEAEDEPSWKTLGYWAARSRPLWSKSNDPSDHDNSDYNRYTTLVICNRTGEENGKKYDLGHIQLYVLSSTGVAFAGSSASFQMDRECGRPRIVDMMTKEEESLRIFDLDLPSP